MSDDGHYLFHKRDITCDLCVPFVHEIAKDHGDEGIELEIDICGTRQCRQNLLKRLMCRWTEDLALAQNESSNTRRISESEGASRAGDASFVITSLRAPPAN